MDSLESLILKTIDEKGSVEDTGVLAKEQEVEHQAVVGLMKSLESAEMVIAKVGCLKVPRYPPPYTSSPPKSVNVVCEPPVPLFIPKHPQDNLHSRWQLTDEAKGYVEAGSPEVQLFNAVPAGEGIALSELKEKVSATISDIGFKQAMMNKWIGLEKRPEPFVVRKARATLISRSLTCTFL